MVLTSSYFVWKDIEKLESQEQMNLLQWQLQAREPIHRFSDMKPGDHLVRKSSFLGISYEHHFICIGPDYKGRPKIVHYLYNTAGNTAGNASLQMLRTGGLGLGTANEKLGIVQEMTLPHKDFIKDEGELQAKGREVERVIWPEQLRRFSVRDVISRALERKGEKLFHLKMNNWESFVMWCLCGLNVSLQVIAGQVGIAFLYDKTLTSSYFVWRDIDELKGQEQMNHLKQLLQDRQPIHRFSDMKAGDHLVRKNSFLDIPYEHHFICIGSDYKGRPRIVHYYDTAGNASLQMIRTSGLGSGTANEKSATVQEMTLPHKDFIKDEDELQAKGREVKRVVWPEKLRRFSVRDVIRLALERKGEKSYDWRKNNCESFVMWCLCGLNVSLQVSCITANLPNIRIPILLAVAEFNMVLRSMPLI